MRGFILSGAIAASVAITPAIAAGDSGFGAPPAPATMGPVKPAMPAPPPRPIVPAHSGSAALPAYVRPAYGFQLPQGWMAPQYFIDDPRAFGLGRPAPGFGWSRYHDDAVLTDRWGRVYDVRYDSDWGRRGREGHDEDAALLGVGGAAVGAVAGNLIAGAGSRLAGSLIGGGVGALAGLAIEAATAKHRHAHDRRRDRFDRWDEGSYRSGPHWGRGYGYGYGHYDQVVCNCGDEIVTTTVTRTSGGGMMVPREVVTYENVYAPAATPGKVQAPVGKERRTTSPRPRVRGDY